MSLLEKRIAQTGRLLAILMTLSLLLVWGHPGIAAPRRIEYHTTQAGEAWAAIAAHYGVPVKVLWQANGVINPGLLAEGQRLLIPIDGPLQTGDILIFEPGTSIWQAALQSGNSPAYILQLNGLNSPAEALGRQMYARNRQSEITPLASRPNPSNAVTEPTPALPTPSELPEEEMMLDTSRMGIQGHFSVPEGDMQRLLDMVAYELECKWVKTQVDWSRIEYAPGQYSIELEKLDQFVDGAFDRNLDILLSIVKAPDWARNTVEEDGPPVDYNSYYDFVRFIVLRYKYKIDAIEVWNEPNLRREWNGGTLSGAEYVRLLSGAYATIKQEDGRILVISAGLAPTGTTNELAVDDRVYLRQMYEAGLGNYVDAVGVHPYGWANPPQARCCRDPNGPPTHNDHRSFFFLDTIEDYRAIQAEFGDSRHPLWATEFGWGTVEGLNIPVPEEQPFIAYVNAELQARYIRDTYLMAQSWDFMGPMFLWNLNVATLDGYDPNQGAYSILYSIDRGRPAYQLLRDTPKIPER